MRHSYARNLPFLVAVLLLASCMGSPPAPTDSDVQDHIKWYDWEPATFELAVTEDKPILLDLTAVWCHWCHVMDETSYSDPEVIRLVNALYIPIRVDTDQRPDVQSRYRMGGWPTTAFLTPEGDIITGGTYIPPEELILLLQKVSDYYISDGASITLKTIQDRQHMAIYSPQASSSIPTDTVRSALNWLAGAYDPTFGGFTQDIKFSVPSALPLIFRYSYMTGDTAWQDRAFHTLTGMQNLEDPVWGGLYRYSVTPDWQTPHYEKVLSDNAKALQEYLEAYQVTGHSTYRSTAEGIMSYTERFLWDPDGGFYGSQDADLFQAADHQILIAGEEYFQLSEKDRLAVGVPFVDHTFYTGWNGQMIVAALEAAAILEEPRYQDMALLALDRLWTQGRGPEGQMWHSLQADTSGNLVGYAPVTLDDQVDFSLALIAAYSATGQREYLTRAEELADYILAELHDLESGGFYDLPANPDAPGTLNIQVTLCTGNIATARLFTRLYRMTIETEYRDAAEGALLLCGGEMTGNPVYALAADEFLIYPLTLVVVGSPGEESADALLTAANRFYAPGKVVILLDPSLGLPALGDFTYPPDRTAIYTCIDRRCSLPVTSPAELGTQVDLLMGE